MRNIRLLTFIIGCVYAAIGVSAPLITLYLEALGANFVHISLILTSFSATLLLSNYFWGQISDRLGRRQAILVGGLFGMALVYEVLSRVPNANWAWVVRILEGMVMAAYTTPSLALMGDLLAGAGGRGRRMGFYRGIGSLAFAGGALAGGRLADRYSIASALELCAAIYVLAGITGLFLHEPKPAQKALPGRVPEVASQIAGNAEPLPRAFLGGVILWMTALSAAMSMWPNFMARLGYSKTTISSLWGLAAATEVPAMTIVGILSDAVGRAPLLMIGGAGIAVVMVAYIGLSRFLPGLITAQLIRGVGYASYTASAMTFAAEYGSSRHRGSNSGLFNGATGAGQLIGMLVGGMIAQTLGFTVLFAACAVLATLSMACFWILQTSAPAILNGGEP
jgi:MFS family permease